MLPAEQLLQPLYGDSVIIYEIMKLHQKTNKVKVRYLKIK